MKKVLFIVVSSFLIACSNQELQEFTPKQQNPNVQKNRSVNEALLIAQSSMSMLNSSNKTRSNNRPQIDMGNIKVYSEPSKTRALGGDTLFYVFNFENEEGFAIVSANKSQSLLAITEEGSYDPNEEQASKDFEYVMELAKLYVKNGNNSDGLMLVGGDPIGVIVTEYTYDVISSVGNYIGVKWAEDGTIESAACSNGHVGSFNLALAMLMSYYAYPTYLDINYPNINISNYPLDWGEIVKHINTSNCTATVSAHQSITYLCRQLGELSSSVYNTSATLTSLSNIPSTISGLGYSCSYSMYSQNQVNQYLNLSHPLIVSGASDQSRYTWLVDGYEYCAVTQYEVAYQADGTRNVLSQMNLGNSYFNHINWGMNGLYNGYYLEGIFDISQPRIYSTADPSLLYPTDSNFSNNVVIFHAYH